VNIIIKQPTTQTHLDEETAIIVDLYWGEIANIITVLTKLYEDHDMTQCKVYIYYPEEPLTFRFENWSMTLLGALHKFANERDIKPSNFFFYTGNFKAPELYASIIEKRKLLGDEIRIILCTAHWDHWLKKPRYKSPTRKRHFKYVNLNGEKRWWRASVLNFLYENEYLDSGYNSYHRSDNELLPDLQRKIPLIADHLLPNSHTANQEHLYNNAFFSIIGETCYSADAGGITEKTYKTFFYRHPFVMVSSSGTLAELHNLGFKTFDGLIDESYDLIEDDDERMLAIQQEIKKLCDMSLDDLNEWYDSLKNTFDHNQNLLEEWAYTSKRDRHRIDWNSIKSK